jgi:hypothetical protein
MKEKVQQKISLIEKQNNLKVSLEEFFVPTETN